MSGLNVIKAALCIWAASIASQTIILHVRKEELWNEARYSCQWSVSIYLMLLAGYAIGRGYVSLLPLSEVEFYDICVVMIVLAVLAFEYRTDRLAAFAFLISSAVMLIMIWYFGITPIKISLIYLLIPLASYLHYLYRKKEKKRT
jgi:predicted membrane protein